MESLLVFLSDSVFLVGTVLLTQVAILAFRSKVKPVWLRWRSAESLTAITVSAAIAIALGLEVAGLLAVGAAPLIAILASPAIYALVTWGVWRGFGCRQRLALADQGLSPFGRLQAGRGPV